MKEFVKHFAMNTKGRDFIVGDIHGCFTLLEQKLRELDFDPTKDRLFSVGDLVDRGPESHKFEEWLGKSWFHAVLGNHEQMLIDSVRDETGKSILRNMHPRNGQLWLAGLPTVEQQCYALLCEDLPLAIEVETPDGLVGIIHAECPLDDWNLFKSLMASNQDYFNEVAIWSRKRITAGYVAPVAGLHKLYVGHTPVKHEYQLGNVHYIDTGACFGYDLTVVQIN